MGGQENDNNIFKLWKSGFKINYIVSDQRHGIFFFFLYMSGDFTHFRLGDKSQWFGRD